ncbi:serine hydrolase [Citromicrobium bathyomarinum]|uniref:serine hydrolase n=1 Tax=Citromicrobium bathyomarinum TaxID=72174 RepID=UPI00315A0950
MQMRTTRAMIMGAALAFGTLGTAPAAALAYAQETQAEAPSEATKFEARAADVVAMIKGERPVEEVISPEFLASVPAEQFAQIGQQLTAQFGPVIGVEEVQPVEPDRAMITLRFEKATVGGPMNLEATAPFLVNGLLLNDIKPVAGDANSVSADMESLSGSKAAWFGPLDGDPVFAYGDPAKPFAIGSTFKLYVLAALARAVDEGRLAWDDVVALDAKSFPSGVMQTWPDGAPVTLQTAATLMISISDNTATDLVMRTLGREAIEAEMRASGHGDMGKTLPFLTTREMFVLKASDLGEDYAMADEAERRAMLATLDLGSIEEDRVLQTFTSGTPVLIEDIEWFASVADQRSLMRVLAALPGDTARNIMAVNPVFDEEETANWDYVGYKGGSEAGVLNMSWLLRDHAGRWYMLAISQMDPASEVDTASLLLMAKRILALAE